MDSSTFVFQAKRNMVFKRKWKRNLASSTSSTVSLKLLIDTQRQKVLFAEAGKDFVDFLFTILSLPIGTVIRLLSEDGMVGTLGKLYESVESLDETYMEPNLSKDNLLNPKASINEPNILKLSDTESNPARVIYMCSSGNYHTYVSEDPSAKCPSCAYSLSIPTTFVAPPATSVDTYGASGGTGFVKGTVTYMIMDDLEVKPMSTISSLTLLNRFNVKDVGALEEKVVGLGMHEGVKLLRESLQSKSVLTNVFLEKERFMASSTPS